MGSNGGIEAYSNVAIHPFVTSDGGGEFALSPVTSRKVKCIVAPHSFWLCLKWSANSATASV